MKLETIDIDEILKKTKKQLSEDPGISTSLKNSIELLLVLVTLLINRLGLSTTATFFVDTCAALCYRIIMGRTEAKALAAADLRPAAII